MMDQLPFPKTRSGWLALIFLAIFLFGIYYIYAYPFLYTYYKRQYVEDRQPQFSTCALTSDAGVEGDPTPDISTQSPPYLPPVSVPTTSPEHESQASTVDCSEQQWSLITQIPQYISYPAPGWIYFELKNENTIPQDAALVINFLGEKLNLLPSMYDSNVFIRAVEQQDIAPGATFYGRIYFGGNIILDKKICDENIKVYVNEKEISMSDANISCPQNDVAKSLVRSIVENVLLPPWANTVLPIMSLFLCFMFDRDKDDQQPTKARRENIFLFLGHTFFILVCSLFTFIVGGVIVMLALLSILEASPDLIEEAPLTEGLTAIAILLIILVTVMLFTKGKEILDKRDAILSGLPVITNTISKHWQTLAKYPDVSKQPPDQKGE